MQLDNWNRLPKEVQMIRIGLLTILFFIESSVMAQEKSFTLKCLNISYERSHNLAFVNKAVRCRNEINGDTLVINQKIPVVITSNEFRIYDKGLLDGYFIDKDEHFTIVVEPINVSAITDIPYNYYEINCVFENDKSSHFYEITKNTDYKYLGNYQKYIDIENELYLVTDISKPHCNDQ